VWTGFVWLRMGTSSGSSDHSNELFVYLSGEKFLDSLSDC